MSLPAFEAVVMEHTLLTSPTLRKIQAGYWCPTCRWFEQLETSIVGHDDRHFGPRVTHQSVRSTGEGSTWIDVVDGPGDVWYRQMHWCRT